MLIGLTRDETEEFKKLDDTLPFNGDFVWPTSGFPAVASECRWLELWEKHQAAVMGAADDAFGDAGAAGRLSQPVPPQGHASLLSATA